VEKNVQEGIWKIDKKCPVRAISKREGWTLIVGIQYCNRLYIMTVILRMPGRECDYLQVGGVHGRGQY
jgi:hypothetical protein